MNTTDDRDRSIDSLLRQSFQASGGASAPGSSCLDAETLGAWADGSLNESGLATVEAHLSECSRCQRIVAVLARMPAAAPEARPWWKWGVDLRWLVPLAAGATAVALWVAVPGRETPSQSAVASRQSPVGSPQSAVDSRQSPVGGQDLQVDNVRPPVEARPPAPPEGQVEAKAAVGALKSETTDARAVDERSEKDSARALGDAVGSVAQRASGPAPASAPAAGAPAAPAAVVPSAAEAVAGARADTFALSRQSNVIAQEVVSPDPLFRWRVGPRGLVQYSASRGATWESLTTGVVADLIAGSSPSSSVCWVVGRAGTVLLTIDGRRFDRVPFPQNVDLTAVRATDARRVVVGSADGRVFSTSDGGATWTQ